jgi:hypothetical protein
VKSKNKIAENFVFVDEARHLYDAEILKKIGVDSSFLITREIVYKGESLSYTHPDGELQLANIEELLLDVKR